MPANPATTGFTAVLCTAPGCGPGDAATVSGHLLATLRAVVRGSRHGLLVSAGCVVGSTACGLRPTAPMVLVQPCDAARHPVGPALRVGPLRTRADVDALGAWLRVGELDLALLPAHLRQLHRRVAAAQSN